MLASEASIVFPALSFHEDDDFYHDAFELRELNSVGWSLVDSAGQRFTIQTFAAVPLPFERGTPLWKRWLNLSRPHRYDVELEPQGSEAFEETLRRVLEKEAAQEEYWVVEGILDTPERLEGLRRCRSIAEIVEFNNAGAPGAPRTKG